MSARAPVSVIEMPQADEAVAFLREALEKRLSIFVVGSCSVEYRGRASSTLSFGERILLIKPDGSLQIHRPWDVSPANWQPPGCIFHVDVIDGKLRVSAVRRRPHEIVHILFSSLFLCVKMNLVDEGEFSLYASEKDMRDAIRLSPDLIEDGLEIISFEKPVEPGFIDLYGVDSEKRLVVLELKRRPGSKSAVLQLARYVDEVRRRNPNRIVRGILVAPDLGKGVQQLLSSLNLEFKRVDPRKCAEILGDRSKDVKLTEFLKI